MWTITRDYWFSSAHRLEDHPKCGRLHGHNYKLTVTISSQDIRDEWIMDYAQLDSMVKPVLEELDHRYIVSAENVNAGCVYYAAAQDAKDESAVRISVERSTAEALCFWFYQQVHGAFLATGMLGYWIGITLRETPKSSATFLPSP
jgi:queuosine biosynthesis protein QueD